MTNPINALDRCALRLAQAQETIAKTRKFACVVSTVAVAGGFGLLVMKLLTEEPETPDTPDGVE